MGEVWSAVHLLERHGVAVKLLTAEAARDERYRTAFRNEIRNAAQLDHPNLVAVYDYGEVTDAEAVSGDQRFVAGTPWLAMEMVEGDTLLPYCGCFDWARTRVVVGGLLHALGHVHARGVYHRDMKPANVLLTEREGRLVVKLSDFGLAHASEATEADHFNGGTPAYMAPEQFDGMWRNYGPWTDLYGLGAMLFALVTGSPPFGLSRSFEHSRDQHRSQTVPALTPPFPVPAGFESWLRRLLEKDPARRYRRGADAAFDFFALGPPVGEANASVPTTRADLETLRLQTLSTMTDHAGQVTEEVQFTVGSSIARPPPLPTDWRVLERRSTSRVRAGLNLLGLRMLPLVGRETHRDELWAALRRARANSTVEVVALHGPMGMGKSRLAHWLGQRAHEVGSAILMRATHGPVPLQADGLAGMAVRFLRCEDLSDAQLRMRVAALVGDNLEEGEALLELLSPGSGGVRFGSVDERHYAVEQLLSRATEERPVVVRLDDVHHGADSLRFVRRLLDRRFERPVVFVLTATDERMTERVDAAAVWEELLANRHVRALRVGPLQPLHREALTQGILGLEPSLAALVDEETAGDPQLTVQLVKDWVERELLVPRPEGFGFADGVDESPPWDPIALWGRRVRRVMDGFSEEAGQALEVAAVLGRGVDHALWEETTTHLGLVPPGDLVEALLHASLAQGDARAWQFAHPALTTVLQDKAREAGRLVTLHAAAARVLRQRVEAGALGFSERLGRHLVGAERPEDALTPLLDGLDRAVMAGDYGQAEELLVVRQSALHAAGIGPEDRRWGENELAVYNLARRRGDRERANRVLTELEHRSARHGWPVIAVWTQIYRARVDRLRGQYDSVVRTLRTAIEQAVAVGEPKLVAQARAELGDVEASRGQLDAARHWARSARADFERLDDQRGQARCWQMLGELDREAGEYDTAQQLLSRARVLYEQTGYRWGIASVLNSEGDIARHRGALDDAERSYRRSAGLFRAIGSASSTYPQYNLALTLLARGRLDEARPDVEAGLEHFSRASDGVGLANAHLAMALLSAASGRWIAWDDHVLEATTMVSQLQAADEDTAWIAEVAARAAADAGEGERARRVYKVALDTWRVLGRDARVMAVTDALAALQPSST